MQINQKFKELRIRLNHSQEEVANFLGIPRSSISYIESGKREISANELIKVSEFFSVGLDYFSNTSEPVSESKTEGIEITFIRHGEAVDDVYNKYGGWYDPDLSPLGINKSVEESNKLTNQGAIFDIIYTSPLKRARQLAEILGNKLSKPVEVMIYLKERNTYGVLSGLNKDVAKKDFPDIVKSYENNEFVLGSERSEDFKARIKLIFNFIQRQSNSRVCCVTHGKVMTEVIKQCLNMNPQTIDDCASIRFKYLDGKYHYVSSDGITFTSNEE